MDDRKGVIPQMISPEVSQIIDRLDPTTISTRSDLLSMCREYAIHYQNDAQPSLERNRHMNDIEEGERVQQRHIEAILVDFINFIGMNMGVDYELYTCDLKNPVKHK